MKEGIFGFVKEKLMLMIEYIEILEEKKQENWQGVTYLLDYVKIETDHIETYLKSDYIKEKIDG